MDGGRTHVIVFTQYLCALNEADVGWRGQRETYQIHVESSSINGDKDLGQNYEGIQY